MATKFTMYWNLGGQGWSETWYCPTETMPTDDKNVGKYEALYNVRDQLVATPGRQIGFRITDPNGNRKSIIKRYPLTEPSAAASIDVPTNAWLALASLAGGGGTRQFWMRGCKDSWTVYSSAASGFVPTGELLQRFADFRTAALAFPLGMRILLSWDASAYHKEVVSVTPVGAGMGVQVVLKNPTAPTAGKPLVVTGFKKPLSRLNGTYTAQRWDYTGANLTLGGVDVGANAAGQYVTGGRVRSAEYSFIQLVQLSLFEPRERRVGKAFFVPRGRRPNR